MDREKINQITGIRESWQLTGRLMEILENEGLRNDVFQEFLSIEPNLQYDWFTDYFQVEQGDRNALKQDFTPDCVCQLVSGVTDNFQSIADICAGTGGLTINAWNKNPDAYFHCEELSERAVAVLLFNMAIRGMRGEVIHGDVLSGERNVIYRLEQIGKFSSIRKVERTEQRTYDVCIMNPPYSLKNAKVKRDGRFDGFEMPPKQFADYGFVLHGLNLLGEAGQLIAVLPHGVLFRGGSEAKIRQELIQRNLIDSVIGLPERLFLNTGIPVFLMLLRKHRQGTGILFVDASKRFKKNKAQNLMEPEHIHEVVSVCKNRENIDRFAYIAGQERLQENQYNLNISHYVDTFEPEPVPDILETLNELCVIDKEIHNTEMELLSMMGQLAGTNLEKDLKVKKAHQAYLKLLKEKYREES